MDSIDSLVHQCMLSMCLDPKLFRACQNDIVVVELDVLVSIMSVYLI